MRAAIPLEPQKDEPNIVLVALHLPSGKRFQRRFKAKTLLSAAFDFVESHDEWWVIPCWWRSQGFALSGVFEGARVHVHAQCTDATAH
jgi:hypothetical protein